MPQEYVKHQKHLHKICSQHWREQQKNKPPLLHFSFIEPYLKQEEYVPLCIGFIKFNAQQHQNFSLYDGFDAVVKGIFNEKIINHD